MVNDFREYAGVIDENDYIRHWFWKKHRYLYKKGKRYIYPEDIKKSDTASQKLYNQTLNYKRMKADQAARNMSYIIDKNNNKKRNTDVYVSHPKNDSPETIGISRLEEFTDNFGNKKLLPVMSYEHNPLFGKNLITAKPKGMPSITFPVGDQITYQDLKDQYKRNKQIERNTKKRKRQDKIENFLEKTFGYVPLEKLKKRIKAESDSRDLMLRFKKKQAEEKEAKKRYATDKRWRNTDAITADKKFKNMEKKMSTQYNKNHKNITIGNDTWYVNGKKINTPFGTSGYVKEVSNPKPEGKFNPLAGITGGSTAYIKELTEKEKKKHSSVNQNKARRK